FDRYVRDVVAERIVPPQDVRKYYDEHQDEFQVGEKVHARHILVMANNGPGGKTDAQAREIIEQVALQLRQQNVVPAGTAPDVASRLMLAHFADAAKKYSEDGSAQSGGDLGWAGRGAYDPAFEEAAFNLRKGTMSGIVKSAFGYHLILVEDKKPAGVEPFEAAQRGIREFLIGQHQAEVIQAVTALTNELRASSKINVYNENIE
ncbi:MAG TPA: peptidylprolyl isomerase, partial [Thermoanaerobaculia bacterium]|nr:peptidylprolyl isomerase [Thermoanaerobaculia bacterium]